MHNFYPTFLLPLLLPLLALLIQDSDQLKVTGEINYDFDQANVYASFDANNQYLVWMEFTQGLLFFADLESTQVDSITLNRGRGPNEFQMISDMYISDDHVIYMADFPNSKILRWDVLEGRYDHEIPVDAPPFRIAGDDRWIFIQSTNLETPFKRINLETEEQKELSLAEGFFRDIRGMEKMFAREGELYYTNGKLMHVSKYKTAFSLAEPKPDASGIRFQTTFFEDDQDLGVSQADFANGGQGFRLDPSKLLLAQDFAAAPAGDLVYVLMHDNRPDKEYSKSKIYELEVWELSYPVPKDASELPFNIEHLVSNDRQLFAFSKEEGKVVILE